MFGASRSRASRSISIVAIAAAVCCEGFVVTSADGHGAVVGSRTYRVRQAGPAGNLMNAWTDAMYDWSANSRNFSDYAAAGFNYSNYIPDGKIANAGQNDGTGGRLDFSKLNQAGAWPTTAVTGGTSLAQKWAAPAPHTPSYFDVWITRQGFDVATTPLTWAGLEKLGRWEAGTALNVTTMPNGAVSPADSGLLTSYDWTVPIAANRTGRAALLVVWQRRDPVGEAFFSVQDIQIAAGGPTWVSTVGGDYTTDSRWSTNAEPDGIGAVANFGSAITAPATVTVNNSPMLGTLRFNSTNAYTLAGTGTVMLEQTAGAGEARVEVGSGSHAINAGLMLHGSTTVDVATSANLTVGGQFLFSSGNILTKTGGGTLRIGPTATVTGASSAMFVVSGGRLQIDAGLTPSIGLSNGGAEVRFGKSQTMGSLTMSGTTARVTIDSASASPLVVKVNSLGIGSGTKLDVGDNVLIVDYAPGSSGSGFDQMNYFAGLGETSHHTGAGLISSAAAANARMGVGVVDASTIGSPTTFLGTSIDATTAIARYTFKGDANINGTVNFDDLLALARAYNKSGTWVNGDSDYNGTINFDDLLALARNYNATAPSSAELTALRGEAADLNFAADFALAQSLAPSLVPEPTTLAAIVAGLVPMAMRRRRD